MPKRRLNPDGPKMVCPCLTVYNGRKVKAGETVTVKVNDVEAHKAIGWTVVKAKKKAQVS